MNQKNVRIGIDLGGTYIKVGVLGADGSVLAKNQIETRAERPWQEIIERMAYAVSLVSKEAGVQKRDICQIGVGCPGTIDTKTGTVLYSNNIVWENVPLAAQLSKHCECEVQVANDADCATMGEFYAGAAKGCRSVVLLTLGTGIGSGVILDGRLIAGTELGHRMLKKDGMLCSCGRRGCLEAYISSSVLISQAMTLRAEAAKKSGAALDEHVLSVRGIFEGAKKGEPVASQIVDNYIDALADGIADVIHSYWPDKILLGGGISESRDILLPKLQSMVPGRVFGQSRYKRCEIEAATLGNDAGWIGAAWLG